MNEWVTAQVNSFILLLIGWFICTSRHHLLNTNCVPGLVPPAHWQPGQAPQHHPASVSHLWNGPASQSLIFTECPQRCLGHCKHPICAGQLESWHLDQCWSMGQMAQVPYSILTASGLWLHDYWALQVWLILINPDLKWKTNTGSSFWKMSKYISNNSGRDMCFFLFSVYKI